jgi:hypothetical protein
MKKFVYVPPPRRKPRRVYMLVLERLAADNPSALRGAFDALLSDPAFFHKVGPLLVLREQVFPSKRAKAAK